MTKDDFRAWLDYFHLVHGVTVRAIRVFDDKDLDFRPRPGTRTPRELIFHMYTQEKSVAEASKEGRFTVEAANRSNPEDPAAAAHVRALVTVEDVRKYAESCHQVAQSIFRGLSDDELARPLESPFGTFPPARYFQFAQDEHWHHRGQLYTYLRLLGKEPPMLYGYS
jgi:uncharacterized damage-inducible protein DinB